MSKSNDAIVNRLDKLYKGDEQNIKKLPLNINDKYAVFSDLYLRGESGSERGSRFTQLTN
jgi:hypothetical protein